MSLEQHPSKARHFDPAGYLSSKTIAALCTPTGGAICILRISGTEAFKIASKISGFSLCWFTENHRKASKVNLKDSNGKTLDEAVIIPFQGPKSFSGEDVVEFFLHGSPIIAQKILDEIFSFGARHALPGEFSFRAVKNGKISLSQAEAIKELVKAENDFALDLALEKLSGSQHKLLEEIRDELFQLVTLAEAGIDFADQDLEEVSLRALKKKLIQIIIKVKALSSSFDRGNRFLDGLPVSIFGLPNAGKSSFFNALLGEDRSIVSETAGTTRDVVSEKLQLKSKNNHIVSFKLADTAGLRKSLDQIEEIGIERSLKSAQNSDLIILVVDSLNPQWEQVKGYLNLYFASVINPAKILGVFTKKDLVSVNEEIKLLGEAQQIPNVKIEWSFISSIKLVGIAEVAAQMADAAEELMKRSPGEVLLTQLEHVQAAKTALKTLERAESAMDEVLFATDIRHAMNELGPLLGETIPDDILGKIFSDFCIGK